MSNSTPTAMTDDAAPAAAVPVTSAAAAAGAAGGAGDKAKGAPVPLDSKIDAKHSGAADGSKLTPTGDAAAEAKPNKPARDPKQWHLSTSLTRFESAVRDIGVGSNNSLVVAEERGRVSVWARQGRTNAFYNKELFFDKMHDGLAFCVEPIFPAGQYHVAKPKAAAAAAAPAAADAAPAAMDTTAAAGDAKPAGAAAAAGVGNSIRKVTAAADDAFEAGPVTEVFVTGGGGANLAKTITSYGKVVNTLAGHQQPVNSVSQTPDGKVLTGSWDGTVKIWQNGQAVGKLATNQQHGTEVLGLPTGEIITGSGNKAINIYRADGSLAKSIAGAHEHVIRKLVYHPLGFASAGNDGHVKLWTATGEQLLDMPTHAYADMKEKFIYGMCVLSTGEFVAAGDDGTVKIWAPNGSGEVQVIPHPGSVRCVKALPNGDFATGCADRVLRIFTRNRERWASDAELDTWDEMQALIVTAGGPGGMQAMDNSKLPDESALQVPGKKDGQILVVMTKLKGPFVFKWNAAAKKWDEVGEALGQKAGSSLAPRPKIDGVEYDFVTDVFVTDTKSVPLGFNRDDDPDDIVNAFCAMYGLPHDYRDQLLEHIRPKVDMSLVAAKKDALRRAKAAAAYKQIPCWAVGGFQLFSGNVKPAPMRQRFLQHQQELTAAGDASASAVLSASEVKVLDALVATISDETNYHVAAFPADQRALMQKLLTAWPNDKLLPVLDAFRCLMAHDAACDALASDVKTREQVLAKADVQPRTHALLVLRALTNWLAKRKKPEMSRRTAPPKDVVDFSLAALMKFAASEGSSGAAGAGPGAGAAAKGWKDKALTEAYVMFAHNVVAWLGRLGVQQSELWLVIAAALVDVLGSESAAASAKTTFFALCSIASMGYGSAAARAAIKDAYGAALQAFAVAGLTSDNASVRQVSDDLARVFGLVL